jgi:DNA modification methylase
MDEKADEESTGSSQARGDAVSLQTLQGDCRDTLATIPTGTVQMCVTSPPYWGLRSYLPKGHPDKAREIGQEKTPEEFVATMVQVFREVRRCLHESGTLWLNLGDSYYGSWGNSGNRPQLDGKTLEQRERTTDYWERDAYNENRERPAASYKHASLKPKDLGMIPWRVALALQADGWWLRSVICWHKKSCMPESVTDRPTNSWEPIFLLAKSQRYFYDAEAVKEPYTESSLDRMEYSAIPSSGKSTKNIMTGGEGNMLESGVTRRTAGLCSHEAKNNGGRNQRNVWTLGPEPYSEAHFATFPTEIPRRAILAGTSARGCCPKCFAPWERVVERSSTLEEGRIAGENTKRTHGVERNHITGGDGSASTLKHTIKTETTGWQPGCECVVGCAKCGKPLHDEHHCGTCGAFRHPFEYDDGRTTLGHGGGGGAAFDPIPCTVLDPFGGSGTTGAVAIELGRRAILCELNDAYLPLIQKRTNVTKGLALA